MEKLRADIKTIVVDRELSARAFKSIIGNAYMAVGSRYHFLIAAVGCCVPSMALGWSHKYKEMFREFGIEDYVVEFQDMTEDRVNNLLNCLWEKREEVYQSIRGALEKVIERLAKNEELIVECIQRNS